MVVLWWVNEFNLPEMKKIIIQGVTIVVLFFSTWILLQQVDWMKIFKVEQTSKKMEEKLDNLFLDIFKKSKKEYKDTLLVNAVDSLVTKICVANNLDGSQIKIHVLEDNEINAFSLPNGHLILYSGLIMASENQEELSGVICHEIAHIEQNHIMKKLIKEVGLSVLISIAGGGGNSEMIKETVKKLSSSAYDRSLEKEADIKAVEYLTKAGISSEPFANFLYRLAENQSGLMKGLSWVNTHPDGKERAKYIIEHSKNNLIKSKPILTQETWSRLKEILNH